jgi:hypothetical protein
MSTTGKKLTRVKVQTTVTIGGSTYRTAQRAAEAWANWVRIEFHEKHTRRLGYAAYHDWAWVKRTAHFEQTAYRRALPIFQRILR